METTTNTITAGTIARTIILFVALINQILTSTGHAILPFDDEMITSCVSVIFTVVTSLIAFWKNNSFTKAAIAGDATMNAIKSGETATEE
jgi:SPP1 family holin